MSNDIQILEARLASLRCNQSGDAQTKIDPLNQLAWLLRFSDLSRGLALSQQAFELAKAVPSYQKGLAQALRNLGYYHDRLANYDVALPFLFQALALWETLADLVEVAVVLYIIGGVYWSKGDYDNALDYALKALKISQEIGEPTCVARALNVIGLVYQSNGDAAKALHSFEQSLQLFEAIADWYGQADVLSNIGEQYYNLGDYAAALSYGLKSLQLHENIGFERDKGLVLIAIGRASLALDEPDQALTYFQEGLASARQATNRFAELLALINLGHLYQRQQQPDMTLTYLQPALALAEATNSKVELYQCHQSLAEVYEQQGDFKQALDHYKQYYEQKEKVFQTEANRRYLNLQSTYEAEAALKKAEIYQQKNLELEQEVARRSEAEEKMQQRTAQLEVLRQVSFALTTELDLETLLHTIVTQAIELLGAKAGSLYLYQPEQKLLASKVVIDPQGKWSGGSLRRGEGLSGRVWATRQALVVDDYTHWEGQAAIFKDSNTSTILGVPIEWGQEFLGVLNVGNRPTPFTPADVELLSMFATQAAVAITHARLYTEVRDNEIRFRQLAENINDAFWITNLESSEVIYVSPAYETIMGQPCQLVYEQPRVWIEAVHPEDRAWVVTSFEQRDVTQPQLKEYRVVWPDGAVRWVWERVFPVYNAAGQVYRRAGVIEDITERKQVEAALRQSEARYRIISDLISDYAYAFQIRANGQVTLAWITDAFSRITGFDAAELITAQDWLNMIHPTDAPLIHQRLEQALVTSQLEVSEFRIITKTGQIRWLRNYIRPIWDAQANQVAMLYGAAQDITERKLAEEVLQESERRFRESAQLQTRLRAETRKRLTYQTALRKAAMAISSSLDLATVLQEIAQQMGQVIDATSAYICSYEIETLVSRVLAEYFGPEACAAERISDLGIPYSLPGDMPGDYAFLESDEPARIFHFDDESVPKAEREHLRKFGAKSAFSLRLEIGDKILGFAVLWESRRRRIFTAGEITLCQSIAQQAAMAMEHAHLYAEAQRRLKEQTALLEATTAISSTLDLATVLNRIVEQLCRALDGSSAYLCNYDPKTLKMHVMAEYYSLYASAAERISDLGVIYQLPHDFPGIFAFLQSAEVAWLRFMDDPDIPEPDLRHNLEYGGKSSLLVRLQLGGETIGFADIWESREVRHYSSDEIALVQGIAQHAAVAIEHARLMEQTRRDAETKTILLQEVNHRVKNNLTTIIGLLYAEKRHINPEYQEVFKDIIQNLINRVQGLATAHTLLSATEWRPLSLSTLVTQIIDSARQTLSPDKQVWVNVTPSTVQVSSQQANHLALIISELATNTFKYALPERQGVNIEVSIRQDSDLIQFEFRDDGPGYLPDVLNEQRYNVGLYLIHNIVAKGLRGEVTLQKSPGATVKICFPADL
jgi:PAS domain S-box-containing protein